MQPKVGTGYLFAWNRFPPVALRRRMTSPTRFASAAHVANHGALITTRALPTADALRQGEPFWTEMTVRWPCAAISFQR